MLNSLGLAYTSLSQYAQAIAAFEQALPSPGRGRTGPEKGGHS